MRLLRRHRTVLITLGIYWPVIFWLTHIPVPQIARQSGMSDKTMHVLAYFVLTFLAWFAISPYQKVRWNTLKPWILLAGLVCYAGADEILQGHVGRSADVMDFVADLLGITLGLGLLSLFNFWAALLITSAAFIFVASNLSSLLMLFPQYHVDTLFHYTAYTAFTLIWIQHAERHTSFKAPSGAWLGYALAGSVGLLAAVKGSAPLFDHSVSWIDAATALFGISSAILISYVTFSLTRTSRR